MPGAVVGETIRELRLSIRSLVRTPAWTVMLILTIAIGIASNASVDGFVRGLALTNEGLTPEGVTGLAQTGGLLRAAALAVFVIACANVASFLLARATARARETAVRVAIGAGRRQLVRHVLADSLLISIAGAASGAILAYWISRIVPAMLFDEDARKMIFAFDLPGVASIAVACAAITLLCGMLPIIESRHDVPSSIIQRESSGPSRASIRIGAGLVIAQMAACTLLMISAGLLLNGFHSALQTAAGRRLSAPVLVSVEALQSSSRSEMMTAGLDYFAAVARAAREVTGGMHMAWTSTVPGNRPILKSFDVEAPELARRTLEFERVAWTPEIVDRLILPPLEGRLFGTRDAGACGGVVLSKLAARQLGIDRAAGRSIETPAGEWAEIIGVVATRDDADGRPRVFHYTPQDAGAAAAPAVMASYRFPVIESVPNAVLDVHVVSQNYFELLGLPLVAGRTFDAESTACRVAVLNEEAASLYFKGHDPVGGALIDVSGRRTAIIGVVRSTVLRAAQRAIAPAVYLPIDQDFQPRMTMVMETRGVDRATLGRLHRRIAAIGGGREDRIIVTTLDEHLSRTALAPERIATVLVGASATIALALGMLGLYGLMSEVSRRRQREFALRIALGARGGHVFGQVIAEGARLVIAGVVAGMLGSILVAQSISRITPANEPLSPWIWIAAPLALALAVTVASALPARKALGSDPLLIMKDDM